MLASLAGCGRRDDVKVYRVVKEATSKPDLPEGWTAVAPGQMRVASFAVRNDAGKQADVSVIPLPGVAGGVSANVNRWRGQVGLPPVTEAEIKKTVEAIQISGQPAELYDIASTNESHAEAGRILAAIQNRDGMAWFFKMTGDNRLVAQQKPAFIAFLKTFDPGAARMASGMAVSHPPKDSGALPPGHPDISITPATGDEPARESQPKY